MCRHIADLCRHYGDELLIKKVLTGLIPIQDLDCIIWCAWNEKCICARWNLSKNEEARQSKKWPDGVIDHPVTVSSMPFLLLCRL